MARTGLAVRLSVAAGGLLFLLAGATSAFGQTDLQARTQAILLSAPAWTVRWSPPDEHSAYFAIVRFRLENGALFASTWLPNGATCYPDIRVRLQGDGFLFHGCTGVPKEMHYDAADPAVSFKGRAFGFSYQWSRSH